MRIDVVEIDEDNVAHLTRHGVTESEVRDVFASNPTFGRNRRGRAANYYAIANGMRVNFWYEPGSARPISAWRLSR